MQATATNIFKLLKQNGDIQFIIPPYQRHYSWAEEQCQRLWDDVVVLHERLRNAVDEEERKRIAHFIGTIVNVSEGKEDDDQAQVHKYTVIDGQQRLTTLTLLLVAMRDHLEAQESDDKEAAYIHRTMLRNEDDACVDATDCYKILPPETDRIVPISDRAVLIALIDRNPPPKGTRSRLLDSYNYFLKQVQKGDLPPADIRVAMSRLTLVHIRIKRNEDAPQAIFESLNSTGMELSQTDLIRNYLLMNLNAAEQESVYRQLWCRMEHLFDDAGGWGMDDFFRDFLIMKTFKIPNKGQVYEKFKEYGGAGPKDDIKALCGELLRYATHYTTIRLCRSDDAELSSLYTDMLAVKMTVALPLLLRVHEDAAQGLITADGLKEVIRLCISYTYRRTICGLGTEGRNKLFARLTKSIRSGDYLNSIKAFFVQCDKTEAFPDDEWFARELASRDLYGLNVCDYTLGTLENFENKTPIDMNNPEVTIEHIMPQTLSEFWQRDLGDNWQEVYDTYLHTIGNLTLTGYNPKLGNSPFGAKRETKGGYKDFATYNLNEDVRVLDAWNESAITARAKRLASLALQVWPYPQLSDAELAPYRKAKEDVTYDLDYYNMTPTAEALFDGLDIRIRDLSSNVKRDPMKYYVAYKLDGVNFTDVQIQQQRLRITVNMKFADIDDPNGICVDMTGKGHHTNGDVDVLMKSITDLPAVMAVIEQAYRKQADE